MSTPFQFAAKMSRTADAMQAMPTTILRQSAMIMKLAVQSRLKVAAPSGRLNVGKNGKKVGVRYDLVSDGAMVRMTGPAHLLEWDTKAHRIPREHVGRSRKDGTRRRNSKVVNIPGVGPRAWANHPGTKGKHPWRDGVAVGIPLVEKVAGNVMSDTIRKALG